MDWLLVVAMIGNIYFIVFCRLMIHLDQDPAPQRQGGLALVASLPSRRGLGPRGLRYWRLYWLGWLLMLAVAAGALWQRYPHIAAALRGI
jgi:hypothetical protein